MDWKTFPVGPDKAPRSKHGFKDAAVGYGTDGRAYGIPCGPNGLIIIDVDMHGANGKDNLARWLKRNNLEIPRTLTVDTPTGGVHYYFQDVAGRGERKPNVMAGVDLLGGDGYVVGYGSRTRAGEYTVRDGLLDVAPAPSWVYGMGDRRKAEVSLVPAAGPLDLIRRSREGTRNDTLFQQACICFETGQATAEELLEAAVEAGLDPKEAERTIGSAAAATEHALEAPEAPLYGVEPSDGGLVPDSDFGVTDGSLVVLAGSPKVGKSFLAMAVAWKAARSGKRVVYLSLDDPSRQRFTARMRGMFPDDPWPATLAVVFETPYKGLALVHWLRSEYADADMVVVDILESVRPDARAGQSVMSADRAALSVFRALDATVLVLHHNRKQARGHSGDPLEMVAGSQALTGAVDQVLVLHGNRNSEYRALFRMGRDSGTEGEVYKREASGKLDRVQDADPYDGYYMLSAKQHYMYELEVRSQKHKEACEACRAKMYCDHGSNLSRAKIGELVADEFGMAKSLTGPAVSYGLSQVYRALTN